MRLAARPAAALALVALAACGRAADRAPGAISADEQQQLNDAAAMLDANSVSVDAVEENAGD